MVRVASFNCSNFVYFWYVHKSKKETVKILKAGLNMLNMVQYTQKSSLTNLPKKRVLSLSFILWECQKDLFFKTW